MKNKKRRNKHWKKNKNKRKRNQRKEKKKEEKVPKILEHDLDFFALIVYILEIFCDHCIRVPIITRQR